MCKEPEEGAFTSVCVPDNGGLGGELEEETTLGASTFLAVPVRSETVLFCSGAASGDAERLSEL